MTLTRASTMSRRDANNGRIERKGPLESKRVGSDSRRRLPRVTLILCAAMAALASAPAFARPPRLVLFIVVDALSSDLLQWSQPRLRGGLGRLMSEGAYYPVARYDFAKTATAPGHATLATGANPWRHGIVANQLINRSNGKLMSIFGDPD